MTNNKVLASMPPGMVRTLQNIDRYPDGFHHGPMIKGLMVRGLVRHSGNRLSITWQGQKIINTLETQNE